MSTFTELVEDALEQGATDPKAIAYDVARQLSEEQLRSTVYERGHVWVREIISQHRGRNPILHPLSPSAPSRKIALGQQYARDLKAHLRDLINVGDGVDKPLGDCTFDDMTFAAEQRFTLARQNTAQGERYLYLAEQIKEHGVTTVKELPPEILLEP
jgi:hypothetical protein